MGRSPQGIRIRPLTLPGIRSCTMSSDRHSRQLLRGSRGAVTARSVSRHNDPPIGPPDLGRCSGSLEHYFLFFGGQLLFPKACQGGLDDPGLE
jgi:hypothetical protein